MISERPLGMTGDAEWFGSQKLQVLLFIAQGGRIPTTQRDVLDFLGLSHNNMFYAHEIIRSLVKKGLVKNCKTRDNERGHGYVCTCQIEVLTEEARALAHRS